MQEENLEFKALVFDMDGVLIDSEKEVEAFWIKWGEKYGKKLNFKDIHGKPLEGTLSSTFADIPEEDKEQIRKDCYDLETTMTYKPLRDSNKLVQKLFEMGARLALVTSALPYKTDKALSDLDISNAFNVIVTADMIKKGKPDPSCYLLAAEKLGLSPEECLGFEDSLAGLNAISSAGMFAIGVNEKTSQAEIKAAGAKDIIAGLDEVFPTMNTYAMELRINNKKYKITAPVNLYSKK